jgi:hypothetical protein
VADLPSQYRTSWSGLQSHRKQFFAGARDLQKVVRGLRDNSLRHSDAFGQISCMQISLHTGKSQPPDSYRSAEFFSLNCALGLRFLITTTEDFVTRRKEGDNCAPLEPSGRCNCPVESKPSPSAERARVVTTSLRICQRTQRNRLSQAQLEIESGSHSVGEQS